MLNTKNDVTIQYEEVNERQIYIYQIHRLERTTLDKWSQLTLETIKNLPPDKPYYALYDLTERGVAITYAIITKNNVLNLVVTESAKKDFDEILVEKPHFCAKVAYLFSDRHSGHVGQTFAQTDLRKTKKADIEYRIFTEYDTAIAWLGL